MPVYKPDYKPAFIFRNGHFHTIAAYFVRRTNTKKVRRQIIKTPDQDFLALDFLYEKQNKKCALLIHGLEGSAESSYILLLAEYLKKFDWDVVAVNLRGCSGTDNLLYNSYHSGIYQDIDLVVDMLKLSYTQISLTGFSLGGNIVLKYMAHLGKEEKKKVDIAAAVSVPCHLSSSSDKLGKATNYIYQSRFVASLKAKLKRKLVLYPERLSPSRYKNIKTIRQFDDAYTAPSNGFKDAEDYYNSCSSVFDLQHIKTPTLLINAQDDPFLTDLCMPWDKAENNSCFFFFAPKYGGHVGFLPEKKGQAAKYEIWIADFFKEHSPSPTLA